VIAGRHVRLVPLDRRHLRSTREWANDAALGALLDRGWPVSDGEHDQWFARIAERRDCVYFAIEAAESETHLGNVWLWDIDWRHRNAEIRIVIGEPAAVGRGVGSETIGLMSRYAFERLNLHRLFAHVLSTNPRARRAFEKAGFELEGTLKADRWAGDRYIDVHILGKLQ
jgi:RimJ/RimL family protein N-acetyltransferase